MPSEKTLQLLLCVLLCIAFVVGCSAQEQTVPGRSYGVIVVGPG